ncbi:MAG: ATP-binding cassette domain-containing protein [Bradymonadaceae bacterium]|nr:ATP-binding cassette domain-containing protein [Lujinxingiaceae bacterium]
MIVVDNISKSHLGRPVLENVSIEIPEGTNLGLIGPGGAGKTLLLKIICGLVKPDSGKVTIGGIDVHKLGATQLADLRFRIGMLFQNYALFDFMNVADNIAFPLRQEGTLGELEIAERVKKALHDISLSTIGNRFPNELSGGMKKRVSFARAVIRQPPILFYDDPTAGLDPVISSKIFILLRTMQQERGTTAVTISHDIGGIKEICDFFAMIDRGQIIFHGNRDAIERCEIPLVMQFWRGFSDDDLDG